MCCKKAHEPKGMDEEGMDEGDCTLEGRDSTLVLEVLVGWLDDAWRELGMAWSLLPGVHGQVLAPGGGGLICDIRHGWQGSR